MNDPGCRFAVHYQPIVDLNGGQVIGFEALMRLRGEDGTVSSPEGVIEEIEKDLDALTDLIRELLAAVLRDAAPLFGRYPDFYVSVNIPPAVLGSGRLKPVIEELNLMPHVKRLVVEVTERQSLTDLGRMALKMAREHGIRTAVDDFGTGHSGIEQIAGLDFDILKIDRSLIRPALTDRFSARMLRGIVALASVLHVRTIAEGVETWEEAFFTKAAGVDYGQGWYWSKALPPEAIEDVLAKGIFP